MKKYRTILIDPPWAISLSGKRKRAKGVHGKERLAYPTMTIEQITNMPVGDLAEEGCHLWMWTTNQVLHQGFEIMKHWGFKYLAPIHWVKPTGTGNYFIHRTQTLLFGYYKKCQFNNKRYLPNVFNAPVPKRHSEKPEESFTIIESVSDSPRLEIFARKPRANWDVWGNEVDSVPILNESYQPHGD